MPRMGLGTWPFVGDECEQNVATALDLGYRLIDTSHKYGNEDAVGRAIRRSGVRRDELFVTSKFNKEHHGRASVRVAYEESLRRTGLEYLDLFLIHWPIPWQDQYVSAWEGLVELVHSGDVAAIGVSNFKPAHLERIIAATGYVPDVNQIQLSVDLPRTASRAFHRAHDIRTEGWSPLGRGPELREDPAVIEVAEEVNRAPAQVILRWQVQQGIVPVARSSRREQLAENIALFDFSLSDDHLDRLARLDRGEAAARDSDDPENGH